MIYIIRASGVRGQAHYSIGDLEHTVLKNDESAKEWFNKMGEKLVSNYQQFEALDCALIRKDAEVCRKLFRPKKVK